MACGQNLPRSVASVEIGVHRWLSFLWSCVVTQKRRRRGSGRVTEGTEPCCLGMLPFGPDPVHSTTLASDPTAFRGSVHYERCCTRRPGECQSSGGNISGQVVARGPGPVCWFVVGPQGPVYPCVPAPPVGWHVSSGTPLDACSSQTVGPSGNPMHPAEYSRMHATQSRLNVSRTRWRDRDLSRLDSDNSHI